MGLIGCGSLIVLCGIGIVVIVAIVFGAIRSTDVYRTALLTAQKDPRVVEAIGSPIRPGFWFTGSVHTEGRSGNADIEFSIRGPKGKALVHAVATKESGNWHYSELTVTPAAPANSPPIDLLKQ
jgi:hypothetical protein